MDNCISVRLTSLDELEKWCERAHQEINRFYKRKKHEIENSLTDEHNYLQNRITKLNKEDIDSINHSSRLFDEFHQNISKTDDYLPLSDPYQTIDVKNNNFSMAGNGNLILVKKDSKLCLFDQQLTIVKEIPWPQNLIVDMFWSKTLAQFMVITFKKIFALDEKSTTIKEISIGSGKSNKWYCGTCTNDNLFLSTLGVSPSIFKYTLLPWIQFVREYQPSVSCREDERIQDLSSSNHVLGVLIENSRKTVRFDICSQKTLERYWSIELDSLIGLCGSRACSLENNEWLIIDPSNSQLLHLSSGGKITKKDKYNSSPIHAVQLDNNILAILTETDLRLHKLC
jgi:hypothetical protein